MAKDDSHEFPIVRTIDGLFLPKIKEATVAGGTTTTYEGWSELDAKTSSPKWKIRKTVVSVVGAVTTTTISYPNGSQDFKFIWDDRAGLTYA